MKLFLQRWVIHVFAVLITANIIRGIHYENVPGLLVAALLLGVFNAFLRPIMLLLSLPLLVFTFGLFILVINACLLYFVGFLLDSFTVANFWAAFWGGLVIGVISLVVNLLLGTSHARVEVKAKRSRGRGKNDDDGGPGPIIDI